MEDHADHYRRMETGLRLVLRDVKDGLCARDRAEIEGFIDAREYGVALETLAGAVSDKIAADGQQPADTQVARAIGSLAHAMGMGEEAAFVTLRAACAGPPGYAIAR